MAAMGGDGTGPEDRSPRTVAMAVCHHTLPLSGASRRTIASGDSPGPSGPHRVRTQIGRYAIEGMLGAGGMAVVYLARDPVLGRAVALKVLRVDGDDAGAARLVREGQGLPRGSHPSAL